MAVINKVEQKGYLDKMGIVKFQLLTYCFLNGIEISKRELECLVLLALEGEAELNSFCEWVDERQLYASAQCVRNVLSRSERNGLVKKWGKKHKRVCVNKEIALQIEGPILLEYKFAYVP